MTTLIAANINLDTTGNNKVFANLASNSFVFKTANANYSLNSTSVSVNNKIVNATGFYENSVLLGKGLDNTFVIPVVSSASPMSDVLSSNQLYKISDYSNTFYQTLFSSPPYTDNVNWANSAFLGANSGNFNRIASGSNTNYFLALTDFTRFVSGIMGYFECQRSTDGITWTKLNELGLDIRAGYGFALSFNENDGRFYINQWLESGGPGARGGSVSSSANGQVWDTIFSSNYDNVGYEGARGIFFSGNKYYVIRRTNDVYYSNTESTNGVYTVYSSISFPGISPNNSLICGAAAPNGTFIVAGTEGRMCRRLGNSTSASLIYSGTQLVSNSTFNSFAFGNGVFVGVTDQGESVSSNDSFNWSSVKLSTVSYFTKVIYNNGLFYAVASNGSANQILYTSDGYNWKSIANSFPQNRSVVDLAYGNNKILAVVPTSTGSNTYPVSSNLYSYDYNTHFKVPPYASSSYQNYYMLDGASIPAESGQAIYTKSGGYYWTAPVGVNKISVVCVGGGGGGGGSSTNTGGVFGAYGGGGGGLVYASNVSVIPGKKYLVVVGSGGVGGTGMTSVYPNTANVYFGGTGGTSGGSSLAIFDNSFIITANGGEGGSFWGGGAYFTAKGGSYSINNAPVGVITGGGNGGNSGFAQYSGSGGGGGGGYNGSGAEGAHVGSTNAFVNAISFGGGGGGGSTSMGAGSGNNGGGNGGSGTAAPYGRGGGGGGSSLFSNVNILNRNGLGDTGGFPGGGGGGAYPRIFSAWIYLPPYGSGQISQNYSVGGSGNTGAVKIIWGEGRSFPNTASDV